MHHQHQSGRYVLRMTLFKGLPRRVSAFGSKGSRQPGQVDDKMSPLVVDAFFHGFEFRQGIDGFFGRDSIPLICASEHLHQFPTEPSQQTPSDPLSDFAIRELGDMSDGQSEQTSSELSTRHTQTKIHISRFTAFIYTLIDPKVMIFQFPKTRT